MLVFNGLSVTDINFGSIARKEKGKKIAQNLMLGDVRVELRWNGILNVNVVARHCYTTAASLLLLLLVMRTVMSTMKLLLPSC